VRTLVFSPTSFTSYNSSYQISDQQGVWSSFSADTSLFQISALAARTGLKLHRSLRSNIDFPPQTLRRK
jgi:hypothetical protein